MRCKCCLHSSTSPELSQWHCTQHQNTHTHPRGSSQSQPLTNYLRSLLFPYPGVTWVKTLLSNTKCHIYLNEWLQLLATVENWISKEIKFDVELVVLPWWGKCQALDHRTPGWWPEGNGRRGFAAADKGNLQLQSTYGRKKFLLLIFNVQLNHD